MDTLDILFYFLAAIWSVYLYVRYVFMDKASALVPMTPEEEQEWEELIEKFEELEPRKKRDERLVTY